MVRIPPQSLVDQMDAELPGIWPAFLGRVVAGVRESRSNVRLSSWFRDPISNQNVGGAIDSQHLVGLAVDLTTDNPVALERALDAQGIVAVREGSHVHVQAYPAGLMAPLIRSIWI